MIDPSSDDFWSDDSLRARVDAASARLHHQLLAARQPDGVWTGRLASSPLATATAVSALSVYLMRRQRNARTLEGKAIVDHPDITADTLERMEAIVAQGIEWLKHHQNGDGGWGDTDRNLSNVSTTLLVKSAFLLASQTHISQITTEPERLPVYGPLHDSVVAGWSMGMLEKADAYLMRGGGIGAVVKRYGDDKTFAAPILANAAMAGLVAWPSVPPLPFELAILPQALFRFVRLPVVSYAIPALVAIGQVQFFHEPGSASLLPSWARRALMVRTRRVVAAMQPESGGFLEAIPLTAFVVMALSEIGAVDEAIVARGVRFLLSSVRDDGSWPIDTNLSTWVTTLAVVGSHDEKIISDAAIRTSILAAQWKERHPFTGAEPGGWGWTSLSGAVPDADDTAGAVLALSKMRPHTPAGELSPLDSAAENGLRWLFRLQNRDGGIPTFCRGWGRLPFDRSSVDLTAHALRAYVAWHGAELDHDASLRATLINLRRPVKRAIAFLLSSQKDDGSWIPLWFGNEHRRKEDNPYYGTAKVLVGLAAVLDPLRGHLSASPTTPPQLAAMTPRWAASVLVPEIQTGFSIQCGAWLLSPPEQKRMVDAIGRGVEWLGRSRNDDGGWGRDHRGGSSVEETAVVVESLAALASAGFPAVARGTTGASLLGGGVRWLVDAVETGKTDEASPIGLYFAKLWYYEELYPILFARTALMGAAVVLQSLQRAP